MASNPIVELFSSDRSAWNAARSIAHKSLHCDYAGTAILRDADGAALQSWTNPLDALQWMSKSFPTTTGRWIGYLGYSLARRFERLPSRHLDDSPLFVFSYHEPSDGEISLPAHQFSRAEFSSTFSRDSYLRAVERVIEYIHAGDVYQVNLAQQFAVGTSRQPREIWERLKRQSPPRYGAFLDYGDHAIISGSPELFLQVDRDRKVTTRPIKGTRPRGEGMLEALRDSEKDKSELAMIVDLERNDLGRVCEIGSVRVVAPRAIETHPTVYHGVATIEGKLRDDVSFIDLLRATFPSGSVTGAPKIRAMQIIDELEPTARGAYCGAIGYLAGDGTIQFNVSIRTMTIRNGTAKIPVGGGIVADSNPIGEYNETIVKARAIFDALELPNDPPAASVH